MLLAISINIRLMYFFVHQHEINEVFFNNPFVVSIELFFNGQRGSSCGKVSGKHPQIQQQLWSIPLRHFHHQHQVCKSESPFVQ
jgi:hypothetical protein